MQFISLTGLTTVIQSVVNAPSPALLYLLRQMLCYLLECVLTPQNTPADSPREVYELYFVFCAVWAFGGALFQDQVTIPQAQQITVQGISRFSKIRVCLSVC